MGLFALLSIHLGLPQRFPEGLKPLGGGDSTAFRVHRTAWHTPGLRALKGTRRPLTFWYPSLSFCPRHWLLHCPRGSYPHGQGETLLAHGTSSGDPGSPSVPHLHGGPVIDVWLACLGCRSDETGYALPSHSWPPLAASKLELMSRPVWLNNALSRLPNLRPTSSQSYALFCHFGRKKRKGDSASLHPGDLQRCF